MLCLPDAQYWIVPKVLTLGRVPHRYCATGQVASAQCSIQPQLPCSGAAALSQLPSTQQRSASCLTRRLAFGTLLSPAFALPPLFSPLFSPLLSIIVSFDYIFAHSFALSSVTAFLFDHRQLRLDRSCLPVRLLCHRSLPFNLLQFSVQTLGESESHIHT